jgi:hypothetical protein
MLLTANAYEAARVQVDQDARVVAEPKPSSPLFEIGSWGPGIEEAAENTDEAISEVVVEGERKDGRPIRVTRTEIDALGSVMAPLQPVNSTFNVAEIPPSNWTMEAGSDFTSLSGEGLLTGTIGPGLGRVSAVKNSGHTAGALVPGHWYVLVFAAGIVQPVTPPFVNDPVLGRYRVKAGNFGAQTYTEWTYQEADDLPIAYTHASSRPYRMLSHLFQMPTTESDFRLTFEMLDTDEASAALSLDSVSVYEPLPGTLYSKGIKRNLTLSVDDPIEPDDAARIGDLYLQERARPSLVGSVPAGYGTVRKTRDGRDVAPHELLRHTQEMVRASDRLDPHSGSLGHDGRIATVSYEHDTLTSEIAIGEDRTKLDLMLARMPYKPSGAPRKRGR